MSTDKIAELITIAFFSTRAKGDSNFKGGGRMKKSFPFYLSIEQLELINKCLWQTAESIDLCICELPQNSEIAQTGRQDISDIKKLSDKITKQLVKRARQ